MLAIRMQRTGRKGHAMFRVVVQDSRVTPTSGKVVVLLGSYDPHAKVANIDKEKAATYLKNGARPSERVVLLLQREGIELPKWVTVNTNKSGKIKNPEKLRKNRPAEPETAAEAPAEQPVAETESPADEAPAAEQGEEKES
jgi:small subunit ribosomal protein S16